ALELDREREPVGVVPLVHLLDDRAHPVVEEELRPAAGGGVEGHPVVAAGGIVRDRIQAGGAGAAAAIAVDVALRAGRSAAGAGAGHAGTGVPNAAGERAGSKGHAGTAAVVARRSVRHDAVRLG